MYTSRADFVFTVSRDFVRNLQTPILIAPEDVPAHPYAVAMEVANLAPNSEVTIYPWEGHAGAHRRGRGPRPAVPKGPRTSGRDLLTAHRWPFATTATKVPGPARRGCRLS